MIKKYITSLGACAFVIIFALTSCTNGSSNSLSRKQPTGKFEITDSGFDPFSKKKSIRMNSSTLKLTRHGNYVYRGVPYDYMGVKINAYSDIHSDGRRNYTIQFVNHNYPDFLQDGLELCNSDKSVTFAADEKTFGPYNHTGAKGEIRRPSLDSDPVGEMLLHIGIPEDALINLARSRTVKVKSCMDYPYYELQPWEIDGLKALYNRSLSEAKSMR